MIENFKNWISALLCIGIFISVLELILPKSKTKKYIYVLVGIVTTITLISPGINLFKDENIAENVSAVLSNLSNDVNINSGVDVEEYKNNQEKMVKQEFINSLKKDIEFKLTTLGIRVKEVYVSLADNYDIQLIRVKTRKIEDNTLGQVNKIIEHINTQYDIPYSKIEVIEGGD